MWKHSNIHDAVNEKDPYIRVGIIKKTMYSKERNELRYLVEILDRNDRIEVNALATYQFGGVFNYEEVVGRGYTFDDKPDKTLAYEAKAGDTVLVAFLNGEAREAVIIGYIKHPARKSNLDITKGPQYWSEFNGIETNINENGEYTVTFKSLPKNIKKLNDKPDKQLPKPEYNTDIGGSFYKFDKTGSFEINDKAKQDFQNLRIDKAKGYVEVNSGKVRLTITKKDQKIDIKCKLFNMVSDDKITAKTKEFELEASTSTKIKTPKVAIGKEGIELLDQLSKLIDEMGKIIPISPVGPCTALMATPQWPGVQAVQAKIKEITGSL